MGTNSWSRDASNISQDVNGAIEDLISDIIGHYENELSILKDKVDDLQDQVERYKDESEFNQ